MSAVQKADGSSASPPGGGGAHGTGGPSFGDFLSQARHAVGGALEGAKHMAQTAATQAEGAVTQAVSGAVKTAEQTAARISDAARGAAEKIVRKAENAAHQVEGAVKHVAGEATHAIKTAEHKAEHKAGQIAHGAHDALAGAARVMSGGGARSARRPAAATAHAPRHAAGAKNARAPTTHPAKSGGASGRAGRAAWNAEVGLVTSVPTAAAKIGAGIVDTLSRGVPSLIGDGLDAGERVVNAATGGAIKGGFSDPARERQRESWTRAHPLTDAVSAAQRGFAIRAGADPDSKAFKAGDVAGQLGLLVAGGRGGAAASESAPAALAEAGSGEAGANVVGDSFQIRRPGGDVKIVTHAGGGDVAPAAPRSGGASPSAAPSRSGAGDSVGLRFQRNGGARTNFRQRAGAGVSPDAAGGNFRLRLKDVGAGATGRATDGAVNTGGRVRSMPDPPREPSAVDQAMGWVKGGVRQFAEQTVKNAKSVVSDAGHVAAGRWDQVVGPAATLKQFGQTLGATAQTAGKVVAGGSAAGAQAFQSYYFQLKEQRTSAPVTPDDARSELAKLQADPNGYLRRNYTNSIGGGPLNIGPNGFNANGHLMRAPGADGGAPTYFRRAPEDMVDALRKSRGGGKVYVSEQVPDASGRRQAVQVEIRPPFRAEVARDSGASAKSAPGSGSSTRATAFTGPEEGLSPSAGAEITAGHAYRTDGAVTTTVRVGLPTPTQGLGVGMRQQDTTVHDKASVNVNVINVNPRQTTDLTDSSNPLNGVQVQILNAGAYAQAGTRTRLRADVAIDAQGAGTPMVRAEANPFVEVGASGDLVKVKGPGGKTWGLNGYVELQAYPAAGRAQVNPKDWVGGLLDKTGISSVVPKLEIDWALQATTNAAGRVKPRVAGADDAPTWDGKPSH